MIQSLCRSMFCSFKVSCQWASLLWNEHGHEAGVIKLPIWVGFKFIAICKYILNSTMNRPEHLFATVRIPTLHLLQPSYIHIIHGLAFRDIVPSDFVLIFSWGSDQEIEVQVDHRNPKPANWQVGEDVQLGFDFLGGGNSNIFWVSPRKLGKISSLTSIFFRWVETTN